MMLPSQINAQVTIKEIMELSDTARAKAKYAQQEVRELQGHYLDIGGSYSVTVDFFLGYRSFDLWEEGLGHIADYSYAEQEINLGAFDQWTNLNFYLYDQDSDYKLPPENINNLGGAFIRLINEQADSSRATIPPPEVLVYYGNPFEQAGEIALDEQWGYLKIQGVRGTGAKSLYIETPYQKKLVDNLQDSVGSNIRIGPVSPGEDLLFYITSSHDIISGRPLYGESKQNTWVYFEDWTDLNFLDVQTRLYNGLMPSDPNEIDINVLPFAAMYGDTSYVYVTGRTNVGRDKNFPSDQRFDVWIDQQAQQYGTLVSADGAQRGASLSNVRQPVLFVSNTVDELGFEPGFSSPDIHARTTLQAPYPPYSIEGKGDVRLRREVLKVGFDPMTIAPGDTALVKPYFEYRDGERQYFPDDHEFFVILVRKGHQFGHLISEDGEDLGLGANYLSPGFKYVAHQDIEADSAEVWLYLATDITYDRPFEQSQTVQKVAASSEQTKPTSNSPDEDHHQEVISALKADGKEDLIKYLDKQQNQTPARAKTAAGTTSEEGETAFEVGYGRLVIKESRAAEEILLGQTKYYAAIKDPQTGEISIKEVETDANEEPQTPANLVSGAFSDNPIEELSGGKFGAYWERKWATIDGNGNISSGKLPSGMIRVVGRYWEPGKEYKVKLKASGATELEIKVVKPEQLGAEETIAFDVFNNEFSIDSLCIKAGGQYGIPPQIIKAQITRESQPSFTPSYRYEPFWDLYLQDQTTEIRNRYYGENDPFIITTDPPDMGGQEEILTDHINVTPSQYPAQPMFVADVLSESLDRFLVLNSLQIVGGHGQADLIEKRLNDINRWLKQIEANQNLTDRQIAVLARDSVEIELQTENHAIRERYLQVAQTRISASYGILQMMYTTAVDRIFKIIDNPPRPIDSPFVDRRDPNSPPELLNQHEYLMPRYADFLLQSLWGELGLAESEKSMGENWENGFQASWVNALREYNPYSDNYGPDVYQRSLHYLPMK